jgi:hypothetical protein
MCFVGEYMQTKEKPGKNKSKSFFSRERQIRSPWEAITTREIQKVVQDPGTDWSIRGMTVLGYLENSRAGVKKFNQSREGYPELEKKREKERGPRGGNAAFFKGGKHGALFESGTIKHGVCQRRMVQEGRALLALSRASGSRRAD